MPHGLSSPRMVFAGSASLLGAWWLWGAVDNLKLPAGNAVRLAERLL